METSVHLVDSSNISPIRCVSTSLLLLKGVGLPSQWIMASGSQMCVAEIAINLKILKDKENL